MGERLRGIPISSGVAMGPVHFKRDELEESRNKYILAHLVDEEITRFRGAIELAANELREVKSKHGGKLNPSDLGILDVHLNYLRDRNFIDSVERIIRSELLRAESAIARVISDFERVMELVENQELRERASDLRDVGLRVLRWMREKGIEDKDYSEPDEPYILASKRISIADLLSIGNAQVLGIIVEEGSTTGHGAILARSMRIPALTGVDGLFQKVREGDFVILDCSEAVVRVRPDERLVREFETAASSLKPPFPEGLPVRYVTSDGEEINVFGSCGTLADVDKCAGLGLNGVGVYRTELLFVAEGIPSEEMAFKHYREVLKRAGGAPVTFRLLDTDLSSIVKDKPDRQRNPSLGLKSIRLLTTKPDILRLQLKALIRATEGGHLDLLVPFVTVKKDVSRVKEEIRAILEELPEEERPLEIRIGISVEVPAMAFSLPEYFSEADFFVVALDDLAQHFLAADRDSLAVRDWFHAPCPAFFRLLASLNETCKSAGKSIGLFGEMAADAIRLPIYIGMGYRDFSISPVRIPYFADRLSKFTVERCREIFTRVVSCSSEEEVKKVLVESESF